MTPQILPMLIPKTPRELRTLSDMVLPSDCPPNELSSDQVPQFVVLACDDNPDVDSVQWMVNLLKYRRNPSGAGQSATFDGTHARVTFYSCGQYLDQNPILRKAHREAFDQGHEIGNHSQHHPHGGDFTVEQWVEEITQCQNALVRAGIPEDAIYGFRTPYLESSVDTYKALAKLGFIYDASIEEGIQYSITGTNFLWPYTLDEGSPGNELLATHGAKKTVGKHPGLWHIGNDFLIIPPDYACGSYGCQRGLRRRVREAVLRNEGWEWNSDIGKLSGFDHNVWNVAALAPHEVLATLKYTLDLRLAGNRAPFLLGAHVECDPATEPAKRAVLEAFVDYALSKDAVRIVPAYRIVEWMRNPQPLKPVLVRQ